MAVTQQERQWVVDHLLFTDDTQKSDLLDPNLTTDTLIAMLDAQLHIRDGVWQNQLTVTAVRSDHPTPDGPNGHEGGNAIDLWNSARLHLIEDAQNNDLALGIGLGGPFQDYAAQCGGYNPQSKLFVDNDSDHLHIQVVGY
jgi:hypothetical protein